MDSRKGSGFLVAIILAIVVIGMTVTFVSNSLSKSKQVESSSQLKQGIYSAEAALQDSLFKLRNNQLMWWDGGNGKNYSWSWIFFTNVYSWMQIVDNKDVDKTYDISVYSSYRNIGRQINVKVKRIDVELDPGLFQAAFSLQIEPDAEVNAADNIIPINFNGVNSYLNSQDHDLNGAPIPGPLTNPGISMNTVIDSNGQIQWSAFPDGQVTGDPKSINNDAYKGTSIQQIIDYAKTSYDTKIDMANSVQPVLDSEDVPIAFYNNGGQTFTENFDKTFGGSAPADYKVVYVDASNAGSDTIHFSGDFEGYGLLVLKMNNAEYANIKFSGQSKWTGLVLIDIEEEATIPGDAVIGNKGLLNLTGGGAVGTHILGGGAVNINGDTTWLNNSTAVTITGVSGVDYSSQAIMNALTPHRPLPAIKFDQLTYDTELTTAWDWGFINNDNSYYRPWWADQTYFEEGSWEDY